MKISTIWGLICLSEKQNKEFQIENGIISRNIHKAKEWKLNKREIPEDYFNFGEDLKINYEYDINDNIKDFKLNYSSIFFYISTNETIDFQEFNTK